MAQPVTVYRWDDPGAPQITDRKPSDLINILKKCLVEGYGTKAGLGWSRVFDDSADNKCVFRNSTAQGGSGGYLRVTYGTNNAGSTIILTPCLSMVDIDDLSQAGKPHSYSANSGHTTWYVIGTATGFYINCAAPNIKASGYDNTQDLLGFFGDFDSFLANDAGRFISLVFVRVTGTASTTVTPTSWSSGLQMVWYSESASVSGSSPSYNPLNLSKANNAGGRNEYYALPAFAPTTIATETGLNVSKPMGFYSSAFIMLTNTNVSTSAVDSTGLNLRYSSESPLIRGKLPGILIEVIPRYGDTDNWPVFESHQGKNHLLLRSRTRWAYAWLNLEEW